MSTSVSLETAQQVPEPVARVAELMSTYRHDWSLCGGWAVDAWLGRQTRDHGDIDIVVFDQGALFQHLHGWQLLAHDPHAPGHDGEWWDGHRVLNHRSHIHARPPELSGTLPEGGIATAERGFGLEFLINELSGGEWVLRREPMISMPLTRCIRQSEWGLPTVIPEVLLFFKATAYFGIEEQVTGGRFQDKPDFLALLPHLTEEQHHRLRESIALLHPDHPWLAQLSS